MACLLCGSEQLLRLGKRSDFGDIRLYAPFVRNPESFDREILRCCACGFAFCSPGYGERELEDLYGHEGYYRFQALVSPAGTETDCRRTRKLLRMWEQALKPLGVQAWRERYAGKQPPRFLDVGCGLGHSLVLFHQLGFDVTGIDTNEREVEFVRHEHGLRALHTSFESFAGTSERFDCIQAAHLIEHVADPHSFIAGLLSLLLPDGVLILETPLSNDLGRPEDRFRDVYHTLFFDHFTLALLARQHGLGVLGWNNRHFNSDADGSRCLFIQVAFSRSGHLAETDIDACLAFRGAYDAMVGDALSWSPSFLGGTRNRQARELGLAVRDLGVRFGVPKEWFRRNGIGSSEVPPPSLAELIEVLATSSSNRKKTPQV